MTVFDFLKACDNFDTLVGVTRKGDASHHTYDSIFNILMAVGAWDLRAQAMIKWEVVSWEVASTMDPTINIVAKEETTNEKKD